jgi:hypothetical protein
MPGRGYRAALAVLGRHWDWPDYEVASVAGCTLATVKRAREALAEVTPAREPEPEAT